MVVDMVLERSSGGGYGFGEGSGGYGFGEEIVVVDMGLER